MRSVYQLTCPSCSSRRQSPFVRHGAVVLCDSCEHKYRIKSIYVERQVTTGPKTLDESDPLLRGESVDLDTADNPAPVKIDDDGNVVGLSGLSELMRQSDQAHAQAQAIARTRASDDAPPPEAKITRPADPRPRPATTRPRKPRSARNKKRGPMPLILGGVLFLLLAGTVGGVAYVLTQGGSTDTPGTDPSASNHPPNGNPGAGAGVDQNPDLFPDVPGNPGGPDNGTGNGGGDPDTRPNWLTDGPPIEDNPDYQYDPAARSAESPRPTDVPTVLSRAMPLVHEGWYVLTPPRGSVEATGGGDIELSKLEPVVIAGVESQTVVLAGVLTHRGEGEVLSGEAHIALVDAAGRVFAETYLPFAALRPGEPQPVRVEIARRHWERARDVRTRAIVLVGRETLDVLEGVVVQPAGTGPWSSVRVTVRNPSNRWLRDALILLWAEDVSGAVVARYRSEQTDIYVDPEGWLDIVIAVPLAEGTGPVSWHAEVIRP